VRNRWQVTGGRWQAVVAIIWLMALFPATAELTVSLKPEAESRFIFEPFMLVLSVNSENDPELPRIPSIGGFTVASISPIADTQNFEIEIVPELEGVITIPPIEIRAGEETAQTRPLRLSIDAPRRATEMDLSVQLGSTNLFVDQPVKLTVTWSSTVPFVRCQELLFDIPLLRNASWDVYPLDPGVPEAERIGLPLNNQRIIAQKAVTNSTEKISLSFIVVPRSAGTTASSKIQLNCSLQEARRTASQYPSYFDNHFFNQPENNDRFDRVWLDAKIPELVVHAQPEAGRTPRYSGIVGNATATATLRPNDAVVGQPMLLTVDLQNLAYGPGIPDLPEAVLEGIGSEFQMTPRPLNESATETSRSFTYVLRPLRSGIEKFPALALQIFDPEQNSYRIIRTEPLSIRVDPDGDATVYQPYASETRPPLVPQHGIRGNLNESKLTMKTYALFEFIAAHAWIFWLLPPLLWLALRPTLRRRDRCRIDPAAARALRAARRFRRTVRRNENAAWKTYLADRFDLTADAVTFETIAPELEKLNVPDELLQAVQNHFARQDTERYAPPNTPPLKAPSAGELVRKIEKATRAQAQRDRLPRAMSKGRARRGQLRALALPILLAICLLPAVDGDAAPPDHPFEQALQIRNERPDEAVLLFTEAAFEFEDEQQFFNAGNSWFFAGENGRALANYLAAESRRPFNKEIREGIAFIRTQRVDKFQGLEKPTSKISRVWKRFCRRSPVLRFGIVTMM